MPQKKKAAAPVILQGLIKKQSGGKTKIAKGKAGGKGGGVGNVLKKWDQRWFALSKDELSWWGSEKESQGKPKGTMSTNAMVVHLSGDESPLCLSLVSVSVSGAGDGQSRELPLMWDSAEGYDAWLAALVALGLRQVGPDSAEEPGTPRRSAEVEMLAKEEQGRIDGEEKTDAALAIQSAMRGRSSRAVTGEAKRRNQAALTLQTWFRKRRMNTDFHAAIETYQSMRDDKDVKRVRMRNMVIREMISTEKNYGVQLETLCTAYMKPIMARASSKSKVLLTPKKAATVFDGVVNILDLHKTVIGLLNAAWDSFPDVNIGSVFKTVAPYMKLYTVFVNKFDRAQTILTNQRKANKQFDDWMRAVQMSEGWDIESLLITPVQRIPRYDLLLKELIKCTPEGHVDYEDLVAAEVQIKAVAMLINERKREAEQMARVKSIAGKFDVACNTKMGFEIMQPHRVFLREDKMVRLQGKKKTSCRVFLFSDMILLATVKSRKQRDKDKKHPLLHLAHLDLQDATLQQDGAGAGTMRGSMTMGAALSVADSTIRIGSLVPMKIEGDALFLDAENPEAKEAFCSELENAIVVPRLGPPAFVFVVGGWTETLSFAIP